MNGPLLSWRAIVGTAALGVLLLSLFVARAGSSVGLTLVLAVATGLGLLFLITSFATRATRPRSRAAIPTSGPAGQDAPRDPAGGVLEGREAAPPRNRPGQAEEPAAPQPARPVPPVAPPPPLPRTSVTPLSAGSVEDVADQIARRGVARLAAPASSVLVEREGRLSAVGTAGDWGAARRGLKDLAGPGLYDPTTDDGAPPGFTLDPRGDWLPRLFALYTRPVPMERWQELSDIPGPLLPLAGLAASGVGVAMPLSHKRRFGGLWVLAQRPDRGPYSDAELATIQQLAREAATVLGEALTRTKEA